MIISFLKLVILNWVWFLPRENTNMSGKSRKVQDLQQAKFINYNPSGKESGPKPLEAG